RESRSVSHSQRFVRWDCNAVSRGLFRLKKDMTAGLVNLCVAPTLKETRPNRPRSNREEASCHSKHFVSHQSHADRARRSRVKVEGQHGFAHVGSELFPRV